MADDAVLASNIEKMIDIKRSCDLVGLHMTWTQEATRDQLWEDAEAQVNNALGLLQDISQHIGSLKKQRAPFFLDSETH